MNNIPKELTPKLLGLVLGEDVRVGEYNTINIYSESKQYDMRLEIIRNNSELKYWRYYNEWNDSKTMCSCIINLDTLTRLCKEWVASHSDVIYIDIAEGIRANTCEIKVCMDENIYFKELDKKLIDINDVVVFTHWVAKEKGLI